MSFIRGIQQQIGCSEGQSPGSSQRIVAPEQPVEPGGVGCVMHRLSAPSEQHASVDVAHETSPHGTEPTPDALDVLPDELDDDDDD
ncbi:MAG TPA: hypothetical protein VIF62_06970, partial [Labilithrix sp.]